MRTHQIKRYSLIDAVAVAATPQPFLYESGLVTISVLAKDSGYIFSLTVQGGGAQIYGQASNFYLTPSSSVDTGYNPVNCVVTSTEPNIFDVTTSDSGRTYTLRLAATPPPVTMTSFDDANIVKLNSIFQTAGTVAAPGNQLLVTLLSTKPFQAL